MISFTWTIIVLFYFKRIIVDQSFHFQARFNTIVEKNRGGSGSVSGSIAMFYLPFSTEGKKSQSIIWQNDYLIIMLQCRNGVTF